MDIVETKKARFENNMISVHKKSGDIIIDITQITHIIYYKPTFLGFITAGLMQSFPGFMEVYFIREKHKRMVGVWIKYSDVLKLSKLFKEKIGPNRLDIN